MQLNQIIKRLESNKEAVLVELLLPYKKSLLTYFSAYFSSEPLLLVISVSNAAQYATVCPCDEIHEALESYDDELTDEDKEVILFNSIFLKQL